MTERQELLFEWIKEQHGEQKRKYSGEPYWTHLLAVATLVNGYVKHHYTFEIGLCHDYKEDVEGAELGELASALSRFKYSIKEIDLIVKGVYDLTDQYTSKAYPELNREARKKLEAERLGKTHWVSQTVKYADLIDNTGSIVDNDPGFAKRYLEEKNRALFHMTAGDPILRERCLEVYEEACGKLYKI